MSDLRWSLTRRRFLAGTGALAGTAALAACGGGSSHTGSSGTSAAASKGLVLAQYFGGPLFAAGRPLRAPFGIADSQGPLSVETTPAQITVTINAPDGSRVGGPVVIQRHAKGLQRAYFPLTVTLPAAGIYSVRAEDTGAAGNEMSLEVDKATDLAVIQAGAAFPAMQTPTTADARGVDPICTASPVCPLHDVTAAQALTEGKPLAFLVATPAFCQVAICGPVLDVLLAARAAHPTVRFLHSEVYAHPKVNLTDFAPAVQQLGLHLEPCLVMVGADGKVRERLDSIYDADELDAALTRLS